MANTQTPFQQGAAFFPGKLREILLAVDEVQQREAEEIRLRAGKGLSILGADGRETVLPGTAAISQQELRGVIEIATAASFHRAMDKLCRGYLPLAGGHRLGIAGSTVTREGRIHHFRDLSSLSLRLAHEIPGAAFPVARQLVAKGKRGGSCLILAPPGYGKTTLLRDLIRIYSDQWKLRVGVADERGEIAALLDGVPQFAVGASVDVIDGCGKGEAGLLLLRSMNPQVIAMDEITSPEDVDALSVIAHCGTAVLATAHGSDLEALFRRPLYQPLLQQRIFQTVVSIRRTEGRRSYIVEEPPCCT